MAKLEGGIFSRPRGKTGGVVFGAARTRKGKVVTSRLLVPPSNPNTQAQQTQRSKFKEALEITRKIGKEIYGSDWNRAISQLPGFQSLMSILMNSMDENFSLSIPPDVNLGTLFLDSGVEVNEGATASTIEVQWDPETGSNGTFDDEAIVILIQKDKAATPEDRDVIVDASRTRDDQSSGNLNSLASTDYVGTVYMRGVDAASGLLSTAYWAEGTSSAA